ncbi:MAG: hypothetical protein AAF291_14865 [Pseudomonadota bacterium]
MKLVIIFECDQSARYEGVEAAIKALGDWGKLTSNAILIETKQEIADLMDQLQPILGPKDHLWIFEAGAKWSSYGDPIVEDHATALLGSEVAYIPRDWDEGAGERH